MQLLTHDASFLFVLLLLISIILLLGVGKLLFFIVDLIELLAEKRKKHDKENMHAIILAGKKHQAKFSWQMKRIGRK
jgi:hypothetical protein